MMFSFNTKTDILQSHQKIIDRLILLPAKIRNKLVVRSMPFGDIIDVDTRIIYAKFHEIEFSLGPPRGKWMGYEICNIVKQQD